MLVAIKLLHTVVWAFFVLCIAAIPLAAWQGMHAVSGWLIALVLFEVVVLLANGWRCPLTSWAARYTDDRRDNFDIYLPVWLARHNKAIFGALFVAGVVYAIARWVQVSGRWQGYFEHFVS